MKNKKNIFVFGSNLLGIHKRGAAKDALEKYGALLGVGQGIQGSSYAIPTKKTPWVSLSLDEIKKYVDIFINFAENHPDMEFYVTRVGCGLAGYKDEQIAYFFHKAPSNCILPEEWKKLIQNMICNG